MHLKLSGITFLEQLYLYGTLNITQVIQSAGQRRGKAQKKEQGKENTLNS